MLSFLSSKSHLSNSNLTPYSIFQIEMLFNLSLLKLIFISLPNAYTFMFLSHLVNISVNFENSSQLVVIVSYACQLEQLLLLTRGSISLTQIVRRLYIYNILSTYCNLSDSFQSIQKNRSSSLVLFLWFSHNFDTSFVEEIFM